MTIKGTDATTELARALGMLWRRLRAAGGSAEDELSWTHLGVLSRLDKDGPLTTADLARKEGMRPQSMGAVVATLEELGLVARRAHPTDGRQVHLILTSRGEALRRRTREAKRSWLEQAIARLDARDQATLFAAAEIIRRMVEGAS